MIGIVFTNQQQGMYAAANWHVYCIPLETYFASALTYNVMLLNLYDFLLFPGETSTEAVHSELVLNCYSFRRL